MTLSMTLFEYFGYFYINEAIKLLWILLFILFVILTTRLSYRKLNELIIIFYFLVNIVQVALLALTPGVYSYLWLLCLLVGMILYPYKKYPVVKKAILFIPLIFFSLILIAFSVIVSNEFVSTTVVFEIEGDNNQMLLLEYNNQGALGSNYSLYLQKEIVDNLLVRENILQYLKVKPKKIEWIDEKTYSIDDALYQLR